MSHDNKPSHEGLFVGLPVSNGGGDDLEWHVKEMVARMEAQSLPIERIREELRASGIDVEKTIERIAQAVKNNPKKG